MTKGKMSFNTRLEGEDKLTIVCVFHFPISIARQNHKSNNFIILVLYYTSLGLFFLLYINNNKN